MGDKSKIEWTMATWNFLIGCLKKSAGCMNCYAIREAWRMMHNPNPKIARKYEGVVARGSNGEINWTGRINFDEETLALPLQWKKPRRIFVNSLSDFFHPNVKDEWNDAAFAVMAQARRHTFQILTKRPQRMLEYQSRRHPEFPELKGTPLPNIWLGVSVEDQKTADERIPLLLKTPAALRWISAEPLLGSIDLSRWLDPTGFQCLDPDCVHWQRSFLSEADQDEYGLTDDRVNANGDTEQGDPICLDCGLVGTWTGYDQGLDWVVVGGESGSNARPMHPSWPRSLRDQCAAAGVPFFFKQWGEFVSVSEVEGPGAHHYFPDGATVRRTGKKLSGRRLDGREWSEYPEVAP